MDARSRGPKPEVVEKPTGVRSSGHWIEQHLRLIMMVED
jgi:hypothetical protein